MEIDVHSDDAKQTTTSTTTTTTTTPEQSECITSNNINNSDFDSVKNVNTEENEAGSGSLGVAVVEQHQQQQQPNEKIIVTSTSNKKTIKHALRQQAKRRRKNTTIASGNNNNTPAVVPRIIVKPLPPPIAHHQQPHNNNIEKQSDTSSTNEEVTLTNTPPPPAPPPTTMREVLASIPGFTIKPRKRTNKKLSTAAQLEQTKEGHIDLETPDSILVNTNLRLLLNKATFASLPPLYQNKLVQLLPNVDRHIVSNDPASLDINNSGLNNEFFARACLEWQDRLAEGEFTPENQQKLKLEADKERSKLDPWKLKHFEPIWGDRLQTESSEICTTSTLTTSNRPPIKTTIKLRPNTTLCSNKTNKTASQLPVKRFRTVGAMTRSCTKDKEMETMAQYDKTQTIPDLLPIKPFKNDNKKQHIIDNNVDVNKQVDVERQENCIVNISDTILQTDEETIIGCNKSEKRRRSLCDDEQSKRVRESPDYEKISDQFVSDDEKISEEAFLDDLKDDGADSDDNDRVIDENSSSSSSITGHHEDISSNATIETVDSLQLHVDYKDETQTDTQTDTQTTDSSSADTKSDSDTPDMTSESKISMEFTQESSTETTIVDTFQMLPNTLILQQDSTENCVPDNCLEAEKLEASVEESDLIAHMSDATFENARTTDDDDNNEEEDRFIDAENYVLESGQISCSTTEKCDKERSEEDIQATLFGGNVNRGMFFFK